MTAEKPPHVPVDGDIREVHNSRESFYVGAWHVEECTCDEGFEGSDNCIYRFPLTWPRPDADPSASPP